MIVEVRGSVVADVWGANIKLEEDDAKIGSWTVAGWHEALTKLTSDHVNMWQDPTK